MLTYLEWDSNFFGIDIFKLEINTSETDPKHFENILLDIPENAKLIYIFLDSPNIDWKNYFKDKNIPLADEKVLFKKTIIQKGIEHGSKKILEFHGSINNELLDLAVLSGRNSRFYLDEKLNKKFISLYALWVENSLNREMADYFKVSKENSMITGFITLKIILNSGTIGLLSIHPQFQNRGLGKLLIQSVENELYSKRINTLYVATQVANSQAVNFYKKCGFSIDKVLPIYHYWL